MKSIIPLIAMTIFTSTSATNLTSVEPKMQVFLPDSTIATGQAVVILPGGGYAIKSIENEGTDWAPWFNELGIAVAVVDYRLPEGDRTRPISDATAAIDYLRSNASSLGIRPDNIGIMGFSAGGHLASVIATQAPASSRPNFQILFYPVISMAAPLAHRGSHDRLLGVDAPEELEREFSSHLQVDSLTPPAIILLSDDDKGVPPANSIEYYSALRKHNIPASLHIYPTGGHGWGFSACPWKEQMLAELKAWLRR